MIVLPKVITSEQTNNKVPVGIIFQFRLRFVIVCAAERERERERERVQLIFFWLKKAARNNVQGKFHKRSLRFVIIPTKSKPIWFSNDNLVPNFLSFVSIPFLSLFSEFSLRSLSKPK